MLHHGAILVYMKISNIKVKERFRKDVGSLEELKNSIKDIGLLQPIVIDENKILICGERRLLACKELRMKEIDVNVVNIKDILRGEYDENVVRKNFTPSESVAIWGAMESYQGQLRSKVDRSELRGDSQRSRKIEKASKILGVGSQKLSRAKQVIDFGDEKVIKEMDKSGNVDKAYNEVKTEKRRRIIRQEQKDIASGKVKLPEGVYEIISIDPPWAYGTEYNPEGRRAASPYPEMELSEIAKLKIPSAKDCILWLWTTHHFMRHSFELLDKWGFEEKAILTWVKHRMGLGAWLRSQSEFCIMAIKGKPKVNLTNQTTILNGSLREHSRKPDEFYEMVNELCIGRKLDYFSRESRKGWDTYGNDTKKF